MTARTDLAERIKEALRAEPTHYNSRLHADKIADMVIDTVAEWLTDDAAVEAAARSFFGGADWVWQHPSLGDENQRKRDSARAALSAVLRATEGDER